ncbi:hypothetical protein WICPIJ_001378 [Wickerhamomyces pijperi]|uniref:Uncharacterized protein n=1 Tax=Wickerhamomyces pijperi TaxID=599730 RepID=A0A9P8QE13_WICPI|nr:hypothetical protein WICPIJ_001378 [Wickerhamomyces pijperi]
MSYKLSATLEAHEDDIKSLSTPYNDTIISASRDSTVRVWTKSSNEKSNYWEPSINYKSSGFINSLTFNKTGNLIISAGQDKLINITELYSHTLDPEFTLIGHESNVCCLDYKDDLIISGSWDTTAKVWKDNQLLYDLKGHNASVWDVKILSSSPAGKELFLTASADRTIKLWCGSKELKNFVGHSDVVRALSLLPNEQGFVSTSNDGTLKIWDMQGSVTKTLTGHESFVYGVKLLSNGDIVSCGEDRTIRIWSQTTGEIKQVITVPCISVWCVSVLPNDDIVAGGSDGIVRVFTCDPARVASDEELLKFKESVESIAINSQQIDESKILPPEALDTAGTKEGQVIIVKSYQGVNEAHQWTSGMWVKVGEVVGGAGSSDKKVEFQGKKWDYVFDVDIQDGVPPLKLPYNVTENPYVAAQRFLEMNDLPLTFTDQVVQFITNNTGSVGVADASQSSGANPYVQQKKKLLPHTQYLGFTTANPDSILKGLIKLNQTSNSPFSEQQMAKIEGYFQTNNTNDLLATSRQIIDHWDNKLVGYDLLRHITPSLQTPPEHLGEFIKMGLQDQYQTHKQVYFMSLRFLCNCFLNSQWGDAIVTDPKIAVSILELIKFDSTSKETNEKNTNHFATAVATLLLNYSIYTSRYKSTSFQTQLISKFQDLSLDVSKVSNEAAYRISVGLGNLIYVHKELKFDSKFVGFKKEVVKKWGSESRFKELFEEIDSL